ncbi:Ktr system potassium transporter B [Virgibacillus dakarensis]|uniref:Ktr system potassium uptake protein B n=1 Tax=Lentibacillus populi TaxID=1827502 RepID=A0A9W5X4H1_9BACI|nr:MULTISPECIES: TrkH family potassium uptake protein [Bacillaceae]MTW87512.1 Ktr system potassium transporter B [Virgibacillus dakarensis]GGB35535.1 ktr system potassium uptake protein B [Lentibacillus populi]
MNLRKRRINLHPPQFVILIFSCFILIGTVLLKLPFATTVSISWIDALFTSTSAMTVTGLASVDTGTTFTLFGQVVILGLIQTGGLGIMTFAVLLFIMLGKKIGLKQRLIIQQALNQPNHGGVIRLVKQLFFFSITIEAIAVIILTFRWVPEFGLQKGIYVSIFHSISAFNNAGFSVWPDSLSAYVGDPIVNSVISLLFITGGIGFTVLTDMWYNRSYKKFSLHTKLMIVGTVVLNVAAMLFIFIFEFNNDATLGTLSFMDKLYGSYFQAVTPRTAGFNSVDIGGLEEPTILLMMLLMFIGAGSASTGGGIKLTTFLIIVFAVVNFLKGKKEIVIKHRRIDNTLVVKSLAILTISLTFIFLAILTLSITERRPILPIVFEVISAFGTVGLSMGLTADLSDVGKCIIIFMMFIGKLGPLTLMFSLAKTKFDKVRYPSEDVLTG